MSGYTVRIVWDLPVDSKVYEELGRVVQGLTAIVEEMRLETADSEGMVFEVKPFIVQGADDPEEHGTARPRIGECLTRAA